MSDWSSKVHLILIAVVFMQVVATPISGGSLFISTSGPTWPDLPVDLQPDTINEDWELLYYVVTQTPSGYVIDGEIRNTSLESLSTAELIVSTADGHTFGIHPELAIVEPGGRAPFHVIAPPEATPSLNDTTELVFEGVCDFYSVVPDVSYSWTFEDVEVEWEASGPSLRISGKVTFVAASRAEHMAVTVFGFTKDGYFVGALVDTDTPGTFFEGDTHEFAVDHGFDMYWSSQPFAAAGREVNFVLAVIPFVRGYASCV